MTTRFSPSPRRSRLLATLSCRPRSSGAFPVVQFAVGGVATPADASCPILPFFI
ncbi:hypothetical protein KSP40_PGU013158 [Platanthera guangdongensis]|uniref:Uncharacterized protein n=1 Tax=Platanthera guangdongensis TaxID=2320717 RepID=A0ABR2N3D8_9ASPA